MSRQEILNIIISTLKNYNPRHVSIFGSFARTESNSESDIDILVSFHQAYSLLKIIAIENELSDKLGIKVDLITEGALQNNRIKQNIKNDLQIIYQA